MRLKPRVLILSDWFVPGYKAGGPIQSVNSLVNALESEIDFTVITGDRDLGDHRQYQVGRFNELVEFSKHKRVYTTAFGRSTMIRKNVQFESFDWIYLNSLFSIEFTLKPLWWALLSGKLSKVILAPRGMLGAGALTLKPRKKKLFLWMFKAFNIHHKICFHATDSSEAKDIEKVFGDSINVHEISNLPRTIQNTHVAKKYSTLSMTFISRVSPKKNLAFAIELLSESNLPCVLDVFGEIEDADYHRDCKSRIGGNLEVNWHGAVTPDELDVKLEKTNFFILPTLNENFGHAIVEALHHGKPCLISDQTPWVDLEEFGAGWAIPLADMGKWQRALQEANSMTDEVYEKRSLAAKDYIRKKLNIDDLHAKYLNLFQGA
ncbi:MAG: hypothetical protein Salg2KO_14580 [Salibacteraceae bacterium]